jgi:hypothetical protein
VRESACARHTKHSSIYLLSIAFLLQVTTVRKTADSLKRLKGRKDGGGKDGKGGDGKVAGAATDTDKICHQLLLDVQEYCRQLEALGVEPAAVPSYAALAAIVAPPKAPEA